MDKERQILTQFLLARGAFSRIVSRAAFVSLFPRAHADDLAVRQLYRHLQALHQARLDRVQRNIDIEVQVRTPQPRAGREQRDRDDDPLADYAVDDPLRIQQVLERLEDAKVSIDDEMELLQSACRRMRDEIKTIVGDLSDLRYGRPRDDAGEIRGALQSLIRACNG